MNVDPRKLDISELKPRITVFGVGGAGGNAIYLEGIIREVAIVDSVRTATRLGT